jgi:hypothetical protein
VPFGRVAERLARYARTGGFVARRVTGERHGRKGEQRRRGGEEERKEAELKESYRAINVDALTG